MAGLLASRGFRILWPAGLALVLLTGLFLCMPHSQGALIGVLVTVGVGVLILLVHAMRHPRQRRVVTKSQFYVRAQERRLRAYALIACGFVFGLLFIAMHKSDWRQLFSREIIARDVQQIGNGFSRIGEVRKMRDVYDK